MGFKHKKRRTSDKKAAMFIFNGCNGKDIERYQITKKH